MKNKKVKNNWFISMSSWQKALFATVVSVDILATGVAGHLIYDLSKEQTVNITTKEDGSQTLNLTLNYGYNENNIATNIVLNDSGNNAEIKLQMSNYNSDKIVINLNLVYKSLEDEQEYEVNLVNNINIKEDIQIEKLTTENFAKLNDMTEQELSMLFNAITNRIIAVFGEQIGIPVQ